MSCGGNPYAPYGALSTPPLWSEAPCGRCQPQPPPFCHGAQPSASSPCCGPTGPPGPVGFPSAAAFAVGYAPASSPGVAVTTTPSTIAFNVFTTAPASPNYSTVTGAYLAPATGLYLVALSAGFLIDTAQGAVTVSFHQNGLSRANSVVAAVSANASVSASLTTVLLLNQGDVLQVVAQQTGATAATVTLAGSYPNFSNLFSVVPLV